MTTSTHLLARRRFLPLFLTQLLNAFNDNLYKTAMVLFVVYTLYDTPEAETGFSALASGLFIMPFFLLSAVSGQLADMRDKARIIRWIKFCEIPIMLVGAAGLMLAWRGTVPQWLSMGLMLAALLAMGIHSTFFGPIKYAILPQHLKREEVLAGTGLVEAGTYIAILLGTIVAGWIPVDWAAGMVVLTALIGFATSQSVPPAPPIISGEKVDWNIFRSSYRLIRTSMQDREIFFTILAISFFWTIAAVLSVQFPPLAKNVLQADKHVASMLLVSFSIGVAIGSVSINALLKGSVSARHAPVSVIAMAVFVVAFYAVCKMWTEVPGGELLGLREFLAQPLAIPVMLVLLLIAIAGGMFVVPLYAFLTTKVATSQAARTVAANNIVNSGAMVCGSLSAGALGALGIPLTEQLLLSAAMCLVSAWLGWKLHQTESANSARAAKAPKEDN
jgi:hypothetical protein